MYIYILFTTTSYLYMLFLCWLYINWLVNMYVTPVRGCNRLLLRDLIHSFWKIINTKNYRSQSSAYTHHNYTGLQNFSQKYPLFGFWLISTNFGSLIPNPKSVFGCEVWILQCCQFCVFRARKSNFWKFGKFFFKISNIF